MFGATGDLTRRKLIPALYHRFADGQFDERSRIIGVSRSELSDADFQKFAGDAVSEFVDKVDQHKDVVARFVSCFSYIANDVTDKDGWADLEKALRTDPEIERAFYLAVAPGLFGPICEYLDNKGYWRRDARVVVEKPLGQDLESSMEINDAISEVFA